MSDKTSAFALTLKNNEEIRLSQVFDSFSNNTGHMKLVEFILLCFSKQFITNSTPLNTILNLYQQAVGEKTDLNKDRFFFSIGLLSRIMYPDEIMPLDLIITNLLTEVSDQSDYIPPVFDDTMKTLLSEGIIKLFLNAEEGLLNLLMSYNSQNIANGRKTIGIKEIKSKNFGILPRNFVKYCKAQDMIPGIISIDDFQKCIEFVVPPTDKDSRKYFSYGFLIKFYEKHSQSSELVPIQPIKGEPTLKLSDLQLILGRIALMSYPDIEDSVDRVQELLENKLKLFSQLKISIKYSIDTQSESSLSDVEEHKKILEDYYHKKIVGTRSLKNNTDISDFIKTTPKIPKLEEIEKMFDDDRVPGFPPEITVVKENPPPYVLPPIQFPLTKQTTEKPDPKKDSKNNRSETPAVKVKFTQMPGRFVSNSPEKLRYESFAEMRKNLNGSLFPQNVKQMLANPAVQPCLIREVFMIPTAPPMVTSLIESAFAYQCSGNYPAALTTLTKAKSQWLSYEKSEILKPDAELFFEMAKGSVYESCKKDELALAQYFGAKVISDRLAFSNPDRALLYCGLGSVLCHLGNYYLSLRSYLMAKKIRERCIGGDTVETATVYNNLGACMYNLNRFQESFAYFELSEAIFIMILGPNHARTLTVKQNINKVKRQNLLTTPDFKLLWAKQFKDPYPKSKKKKSKGKKKKSKG
jgi:tetratricopeptide (TPR) repeat protein